MGGATNRLHKAKYSKTQSKQASDRYCSMHGKSQSNAFFSISVRLPGWVLLLSSCPAWAVVAGLQGINRLARTLL